VHVLHLGLFDVYITRRGYVGGDLHGRHTHDTLYESPLYGSVLEFCQLWSYDVLAFWHWLLDTAEATAYSPHMYNCVSKDDHSDNHYYFTIPLCTLWSLKKFYHCKSDREITESDITIIRTRSHVLSVTSRASFRFLGWRVWVWTPRFPGDHAAPSARD
jgi:hypothetical protein